MKTIKTFFYIGLLTACAHTAHAQTAQISSIQFSKDYTSLSFELFIEETKEELTNIKFSLNSGHEQEYITYRLTSPVTSGNLIVTIPLINKKLQTNLSTDLPYCLSIPELSVRSCSSDELQSFKGSPTTKESLIATKYQKDQIVIDINSDNDQLATVTLYDVTGKVIPLNKSTFPLIKGVNHFEVPCNNLATGIYVLTLHNQNGTVISSSKIPIR